MLPNDLYPRRYDALAPSRLDRLQDDFIAFTQQFAERKLGNSFSWSEPTDIAPFLFEGTMLLASWILCGSHLAETHGSDLTENFNILENDMSILGLVLNFPTPSVRRRDKAKKRVFEIIQQEYKERVMAIQEGKQIDDDFMSVVLAECLGDEAVDCGDEGEMMQVIKRPMLITYGLIWAVSATTTLPA